MNPSNCMYGAPHSGQYVAVRSKVGRTVGWLCALHFKNHEKALLGNGYHFRTQEELQARGEANGGDQASASGGTDMAPLPTPEQQQLGYDDSGWDSEALELAYGGSARRDIGGRSHGSAANEPTTGTHAAEARGDNQAPQKELEARATRASSQAARSESGTPASRDTEPLDWPAWTQGAGFLSLSEEQRGILQAPFDDSDITIRYDGVVYAPWRKYWSRMVKAFAPLVPSVIPIGNPRFQGSEIIVGVVMVCGGTFIGKAWGSHRLEGANDRMAVGDRIESAISDAISKIGKRLDMGAQLWEESYRAYWVSQYAEQYTNRGRTSWRRKPATQVEEHEDDIPTSRKERA